MSKKGLNITISVILLFVFLISASAHSGRTDANGGHWNHSTGEYHYHTGEYAGRSQSSSSSSSGTRASQEVIDIIKRQEAQRKGSFAEDAAPSYVKIAKYRSASKNTDESTTSQVKKKTSFWDVVGIIFPWIILLSPFLAEIYADIFPSRFEKKMRKIRKERDKQLKQEAIQRRQEEKERFLTKEEELRKEKALLKKEKRESFLNRYFFWRR